MTTLFIDRQRELWHDYSKRLLDVSTNLFVHVDDYLKFEAWLRFNFETDPDYWYCLGFRDAISIWRQTK